eukprot:scaffold100023_cov18-Prasinocladus_malaysianus.AAC.1
MYEKHRENSDGFSEELDIANITTTSFGRDPTLLGRVGDLETSTKLKLPQSHCIAVRPALTVGGVTMADNW